MIRKSLVNENCIEGSGQGIRFSPEQFQDQTGESGSQV
jgi:hypothetical protein